MKKHYIIMLLLAAAGNLFAQQETTEEQPQTVFSFKSVQSSGFYGAVTNASTSINGEYANLNGLYFGYFVNQKLFVGIAGAATNTSLRVPEAHKTIAGADLRYQYGHFGLMTEYVMNSNKKVHFAFNLLSGAGFTAQYLDRERDERRYKNYSHDTDFFVVLEPGAQVEVNLTRWMRVSPGISYRQTIGSDAKGLGDSDLSNVSGNVTLKFGKF
ncbi:hypothetical protein [Dawidia soli]|uniref:Outer membrane protein beta-barrel domain-containing protein n=1 Tax=Dawidia soli TaxID=2782352 RepID=A0AAP2D7F3_9BACT|nr:hypothetical protein [Dawidia soli]MBT1686838.1 hypothetical protein [Dawidia soli]